MIIIIQSLSFFFSLSFIALNAFHYSSSVGWKSSLRFSFECRSPFLSIVFFCCYIFGFDSCHSFPNCGSPLPCHLIVDEFNFMTTGWLLKYLNTFSPFGFSLSAIFKLGVSDLISITSDFPSQDMTVPFCVCFVSLSQSSKDQLRRQT